MSDRSPMTYDFTDREILLMREACQKSLTFASGGANLAATARMEQAGLITCEEVRGKQMIRATRLGREAWLNQGLRAAGRPLIRLAGA